MNLVDKGIDYLFPKWGNKRRVLRQKRLRLEEFYEHMTKRSTFEAVADGRSRSDFLSTSADANKAIEGGSASVRQHVRQMEYNTGYVSGPIQRDANNVIQRGLKFQSRVKADSDGSIPAISRDWAKTWNSQAEKWFKRWAEKADQRLLINFDEMQRIIEMTLMRDGEVLAIGRKSTRRDRIIPYCIEVLEIDRLQTPPSEMTNPKIINGIEIDEEGVPKIYYVLKEHPGSGNIFRMGLKNDDYEEIKAYNDNGTKKVLHLFDPRRPEQYRSPSLLVSALMDLQDQGRYREANILTAIEEACMTGTVYTDNPETFQQYATESGDANTNYNRIHEFAVNQIHYLRPGEKFELHAPKRPNENFDAMIKEMLASAAMSQDMPGEALFNMWQGLNYSNARTILLQFYLPILIRAKRIKDHFCRPVFENVMSDLIAFRKMDRVSRAAMMFMQRREDLLEHEWIHGGWQWVDPLKEAQGKELELLNNMTTLGEIVGSRGGDPEEVLWRRGEELLIQKEVEEKLGVKFPSSTKSKVEPSADEGNQSKAA